MDWAVFGTLVCTLRTKWTLWRHLHKVHYVEHRIMWSPERQGSTHQGRLRLAS
jgi:hypothetical protein